MILCEEKGTGVFWGCGPQYDLELYSLDKEKSTASKIDTNKLNELAIKINFYDPQRIDEIISLPDKLNGFLVKHFDVKTTTSVEKFNEMFSVPKFLDFKKEELLIIKRQNTKLKLYLNINWQKGKVKLVEFSELNNSLKRTVMLTMIIMSSRFGPVIIDAPENYLDNIDIAEILVPVIKKSKDFRQIIFFTSNPILAVNSDPENYILLKSGLKKRRRISFGFSIDEADKKFQVIDLIEGGIKSFNKRSKRYSL